MLVISSREFRDKQKSYLDKVDNGTEVLIQRGKNKSYKVSAVSERDTLMTKEAFFNKIDAALEAVKNGEFTEVKNREELTAFLARL